MTPGPTFVHQKFQAAKAGAAWEQQVRRLNRLPFEAKRQLIRWLVGAWKGRIGGKVSALTAISKLGEAMFRKRVRWAAFVYGGHLPELRPVAERIIREVIGAEVQLRWISLPDRAASGEVEFDPKVAGKI
ncbi:hypothetical protein BGX38DRAFT_1270434 [Terfezia claveryi]|nr:hypothetical protein BGX38DRAFT_1270434 [Terfezia claveryi]